MNGPRLSSVGVFVVVAMGAAACRSSSESGGGSPVGASSGATTTMTGGDATKAHGGGPMQVKSPSPETAALLAKIQSYPSWPKFPENLQPTFSKQHNRMWVVAHYNDVVSRAIQEKTLPLPEGSIIVKDNFDSGSSSKPTNVTTMSKQGGRWYWAETTPEGQVVVMDGKPLEGFNVPACANCHAQATGNDQVYTHEFK
jgi:hypothetical protein